MAETQSEEPAGKRTATETEHYGEVVREGLIGGMHGVHTVASEGVGLIRDVATETVRAAGAVGALTVDTARGLLVGMADGLRDVLGRLARRDAQPPEEPRH